LSSALRRWRLADDSCKKVSSATISSSVVGLLESLTKISL